MRLADFLIDWIFPNRCPCCNNFIVWNRLICEACLHKIELTGDEVCYHCGKPNCVCGKRLNYSECVTGAYYDGAARDGIINLKLNGGINFANFFSEILSKKLIKRGLCNEIDIVTSVPVTKDRLRQAGYNHASEIARAVSKKIGKRFCDNILVKTDKKLTQHILDLKSRSEAVRGAYKFSQKNDISGKTILLCDDVITTSSTLNECSLQLKNAGAKKVMCAVIATTRLKYIAQ